MVNRERIRVNLENMSNFGRNPITGGIMRLAYSTDDLLISDFMVKEMKRMGLKVFVDGVGNVWGRREGTNDELPPVCIGSHLDTVRDGGAFDGAAGVVGAWEVLNILNEKLIETKRPIEFVIFACEEGARFGTPMVGSGFATGNISFDELGTLVDADGITAIQAMNLVGLYPKEHHTPINKKYAFIELHIEQGRVLWSKGYKLGIVTGISAPTRMWVEFFGRTDHSGATPMNERLDALAAAARSILFVEQIAKENVNLVGTVGNLELQNPSINTIPGYAKVWIDMRSTLEEEKRRAVTNIINFLNSMQAEYGIKVNHQIICDKKPVQLSEKIRCLLCETAENIGSKYMLMGSGAGHDAMHMHSICEVGAGMIFIPSVEGISHSPKEYTRMEDIVFGIELMVNAVLKLANE